MGCIVAVGGSRLSPPVTAGNRAQGSRGLLPLLTTCVRHHDWSSAPAGLEALLAQADHHQLLAAARRHRVSGCVRNSVRHLPSAVEPAVVQALDEDSAAAVAQQMRALSALHQVGGVLNDAVSTWAAVKGPVLAAHVYDRPDLRSYKDVDVLVRPSELAVALEALEAAGCTVLDRNWTLLRERALGELHVLVSSGIIIDLHWSLLYEPDLRRVFRAPTDVLLDRSVEVDVAGLAVRTLDPFDTVVHLAVHAAVSGGDRLVWLKDLEQALRHLDDPDGLAATARQWQAQLPVAAMLTRTGRLLGAGLPGLDLDDLRGSRTWGLLLRALEAGSDVASGGERGSAVRLFTRALREDGTSSALEASRRAWAWLRQGPSAADRTVPGSSSPESVLFESGGPAVRREYLQAVAGWS
jgi:hypothetical protein